MTPLAGHGCSTGTLLDDLWSIGAQSCTTGVTESRSLSVIGATFRTTHILHSGLRAFLVRRSPGIGVSERCTFRTALQPDLPRYDLLDYPRHRFPGKRAVNC